MEIECDVVIRYPLIDAQDRAFQIQTEIAETLQLESRQDAVRLGAGVSQQPQASHFGWRHAIASIL
jgi:hypothetical protein